MEDCKGTGAVLPEGGVGSDKVAAVQFRGGEVVVAGKGLQLEGKLLGYVFFFSSRRRHTRLTCDWSSDVCSSDFEVGNGVPGDDSPPAKVTGLANVTAIASGDSFSCAVNPAGVSCWGLDDDGELGDRSEERRVGEGGGAGWATSQGRDRGWKM